MKASYPQRTGNIPLRAGVVLVLMGLGLGVAGCASEEPTPGDKEREPLDPHFSDGTECSGHGHTHGPTCHCDSGYVREPAAPLRCVPTDWDPCSEALAGNFDYLAITTSGALGEGTLAAIDESASTAINYDAAGSSVILNVLGTEVARFSHPEPVAEGASAVLHAIGPLREGVGALRASAEAAAATSAFVAAGSAYDTLDLYELAELDTEDFERTEQALVALSRTGTRLGYLWDATQETFRSFRVDNEAQLEAVEVENAVSVRAIDMNNAHAVVGYALTPDGQEVGFVTAAGGPSVIHAADDAAATRLVAINNGDFVAGHVDRDGASAAFVSRSTADSERVAVRPPGALSTELVGLTDRCTVAGIYLDAAGARRAFFALPRGPSSIEEQDSRRISE